MKTNLAFIVTTALIAVSVAVFESDITNRKDLATHAITTTTTSNDFIVGNSKRMNNDRDTESDTEERLRSQLSSITGCLMAKIQYLNFNSDHFKYIADELSQEISQVDLSIKQLSPPREELLKKLDFTQRVFCEMLEAVQYESLFPKTEGSDYTIAMQIVAVNLNLLTFFDDAGKPSPELPVWHSRDGSVLDLNSQHPADGYMMAYKGRFEGMCSKFAKERDVVVPVRRLYEQQVHKARKTFDLLYAGLRFRD